MMFQSSSHPPIGVDLGAAALKAVQLGRRGGVQSSLVLSRQAMGPESDAEELSRLASLLDRQGFVGTRVVTACPWKHVMTEPLHLPPADSGAPREVLASAEFARTRQLEPGTFEMGFWSIPEPARGGAGSFVMATAALHADAEALYETFTQVGLDLLAIDTPAVAHARGLAPLFADSQGLTLLVDLGWTQMRVTALLGGVIVFERGNDEGGTCHLHEQLSASLSITPEAADVLICRTGLEPATLRDEDEAPAWRAAVGEVHTGIASHFEDIARDLGMAINYVGHRYPDTSVDQVILIGGGAALPGVADYIGSSLGAPARAAEAEALGIRQAQDDQGCSLALAMGLARHSGNAKGVAA